MIFLFKQVIFRFHVIFWEYKHFLGGGLMYFCVKMCFIDLTTYWWFKNPVEVGSEYLTKKTTGFGICILKVLVSWISELSTVLTFPPRSHALVGTFLSRIIYTVDIILLEAVVSKWMLEPPVLGRVKP